MKYFIISPDIDSKKIGHYPQTELTNNCKVGPPDGIHQVKPHELPNFTPELKLNLFKHTIRTDYLSNAITSCGIVISNKFKSILEKFTLPPHDFYKTEVNSVKEKYIYNWFHFISTDFIDFLDLEKSKAITVDITNKHSFVEHINLDTDLDQLKKKIIWNFPYNHKAKWNKIVFKNGFPKYDLFKTQIIEYETIISERLLNALKEANITGFITKPYVDIEFQ